MLPLKRFNGNLNFILPASVMAVALACAVVCARHVFNPGYSGQFNF